MKHIVSAGFLFFLLGASVTRTALGADVCRDCDCYECTGDKVVNGERIITISSESCKSSAISWQCCLGSSGGGDGSCYVTSGCNKEGKQKCEGVNSFDLKVPSDATSVQIQGHDGRFTGFETADKARCGGTPNGGSCGKDSNGVCTKSVDISEGKCGSGGGGMGDPHFLTWGQEWFDFMVRTEEALSPSDCPMKGFQFVS